MPSYKNTTDYLRDNPLTPEELAELTPEERQKYTPQKTIDPEQEALAVDIANQWKNDAREDMTFLGDGLAVDNSTMAWIYGLRSLGVPMNSESILSAAQAAHNNVYTESLNWLNDVEWTKLIKAVSNIPSYDNVEYGSTPVELLVSMHSMGLPSDPQRSNTQTLLGLIESGGGPYSGVAKGINSIDEGKRSELALDVNHAIGYDEEVESNEAGDPEIAPRVMLVERVVPTKMFDKSTNTFTTEQVKKRMLVQDSDMLPTDKVLKEDATWKDRDDIVDVVRYEVVPTTVPDPKDPSRYVTDDPMVVTHNLELPRSEMGPNDFLVGQKMPTNEEFLRSKGHTKSKSFTVPDIKRVPPKTKTPELPKEEPVIPNAKLEEVDDARIEDIESELGLLSEQLENDAPLAAPTQSNEPALEMPKNPRADIIENVPSIPSEQQDVAGERNKSKAMTEFMNEYESLFRQVPSDIKPYDYREALPIQVYQNSRPPRELRGNEEPKTVIRGGQWVVAYDDQKMAIVLGVTPDGNLAVRKFPSGEYDEWNVKSKEVRISNTQGKRTISY